MAGTTRLELATSAVTAGRSTVGPKQYQSVTDGLVGHRWHGRAWLGAYCATNCATIFLSLVFCFAVGLLLAVSLHAQERKAFTLPFHSINTLILLDATVNGKPATLLLDTGANRTLISNRYGGPKLKPSQRNRAGITGESVRATVNLSLESHMWAGQTVTVMDLHELQYSLGIEFDGLLGQDILRGFSAVRIDYKAGLVEFEQ